MAAWMLGGLTHDPLPVPRHPYLFPCQLPHLHLAAAPLQLHVQSCVMCRVSCVMYHVSCKQEARSDHLEALQRQPKKQAQEEQAWSIDRQSQDSDVCDNNENSKNSNNNNKQ